MLLSDLERVSSSNGNVNNPEDVVRLSCLIFSRDAPNGEAGVFPRNTGRIHVLIERE